MGRISEQHPAGDDLRNRARAGAGAGPAPARYGQGCTALLTVTPRSRRSDCMIWNVVV
jgi:hypothetical protein